MNWRDLQGNRNGVKHGFYSPHPDFDLRVKALRRFKRAGTPASKVTAEMLNAKVEELRASVVMLVRVG